MPDAVGDVKKWIKKINAMMIDACEGDAPQPMKMMIMKNVVDDWAKQFKKLSPEGYVEMKKLSNMFLKDFMHKQTFDETGIEEAKRSLYEVDDGI